MEAQTALTVLARPRMAGSPGARDVEAELKRRFERLGYGIREFPFEFSSWPGRFGVSAAGALLGVALAAAATLLLIGSPLGAILVLVAAAAALTSFGFFANRAIRDLPWGRIASTNWLVARPGVRPRYLVMAHRDSKSQGGSLYVRAGAVVVGPLSAAGLLALALLAWLQPDWGWALLTLAVALPGLVAALVLVLCYAADRSPGALDNASGLAALLVLARREAAATDVAFLVTDAEELGLAGALAVAGQLPPVAGIINLDGLDDDGEFYIVDRHGYPARATAPHLSAALQAAARGLDWPARTRHLPPGILADHVALANAGRPALTLMRGTPRSLRRVHRPDDHAGHLTGAGAAGAAALVSAALTLLRARAVRAAD